MFSVWARQQPRRGLGALSFNMNKAAYYVGEAPTYNLSGGAAYSPVDSPFFIEDQDRKSVV